MWAKKILLLSCLYPLLLFFVIGYTNAYTLKKAFVPVHEQSNGANMGKLSFISPIPSTAIVSQKSVTVAPTITDKPKEEKKESAGKPTAKPSVVSATDMKASIASDSAAEASVSAKKPSPTETPKVIAPTKVPSVNSKSIFIDEKSQSSIIVPASSTRIVSPETNITPTQNTQIQP